MPTCTTTYRLMTLGSRPPAPRFWQPSIVRYAVSAEAKAELNSAADHVVAQDPSDRTQEWMQRSSSTGKRKLLQGTQEELGAVNKLMDDNAPPEVLRAKCGDFYLDAGHQPCRMSRRLCTSG